MCARLMIVTACQIIVLPLRESYKMAWTEVRTLSSVSDEYNDIRCGGNLFTINKAVLKFPLDHTLQSQIHLEHSIKEPQIYFNQSSGRSLNQCRAPARKNLSDALITLSLPIYTRLGTTSSYLYRPADLLALREVSVGKAELRERTMLNRTVSNQGGPIKTLDNRISNSTCIPNAVYPAFEPSRTTPTTKLDTHDSRHSEGSSFPCNKATIWIPSTKPKRRSAN